MSNFTEAVVEEAVLAWLASVGWQVRNGAGIAPGEPFAERDDYGQVVLAQRLRETRSPIVIFGEMEDQCGAICGSHLGDRSES